MITQDELLTYYGKCNAIERGERKLKLAKAERDDTRKELINRMHKKEKVQKGDLTINVRSDWKRASVSWKTVVKDLKGSLFVEKILAEVSRDEVFVLEVDHVNT